MDLRWAGRVFGLAAALGVALISGAGQAQSVALSALPEASPIARTRNPVFPAADPHIIAADGRWWIYATTPGKLGKPAWQRFYAYASDDLQRWTRTGPIFSFEGVDWIEADGVKKHYLWAPALIENKGRYYLYYSVGPQNPTPSRIGVAVADTPAGPFKDSGAVLITSDKTWEAIDPMVFIDPKTKTPYLYAGGSAGAQLRVFELEADLVRVKREITVPQPPGFTEGPFMHERNGVYYLSYSGGSWWNSTYSAHYAMAPSPLGPWTYLGFLLKSDAQRKGPGHHSIAQNPKTGEWFIAYHRWESSSDGPYEGDRQIAIQKISYNPDGTIQPIRMDTAPLPASPITVP